MEVREKEDEGEEGEADHVAGGEGREMVVMVLDHRVQGVELNLEEVSVCSKSCVVSMLLRGGRPGSMKRPLYPFSTLRPRPGAIS